MYQVDLARYYKQKEAYESGEAVPEISAEEATRLYNEHLKSGLPFKGRKGRKLQDIPPPAAGVRRAHSDDSSEESEPETAPPPKAKRQKKDDGKPAKAPAAKMKGAPAAPGTPAGNKAEVSP
jgi:hypothetical protein